MINSSQGWIRLSERQPSYGKLVYTRDDKDQIGVYTRHRIEGIGDGWTSMISTDNNQIVEWLDQGTACRCERGIENE